VAERRFEYRAASWDRVFSKLSEERPKTFSGIILRSSLAIPSRLRLLWNTMTSIKQQDLIQSIADSLQYISYYHPVDYLTALGRAYELERSAAAKDAIAHQ